MTTSAGALYANARAKTGLNFSDGRLDDNNLVGALQAINDGLQEMAADHDWDWLYLEGTIPVVAGTDRYSLPSQYMRVLWVADPDGRTLSLRQRRDSTRFRGQTAAPRFYSVLNGYLYLSPTPSEAGTYTFGYYTSLPKVEADTIAALDDVVIQIPDLFTPLATLYITKHISMMFKDYESYRMVSEQISTARQRLNDNVRRSLGPMAPQTRHD